MTSEANPSDELNIGNRRATDPIGTLIKHVERKLLFLPELCERRKLIQASQDFLRTSLLEELEMLRQQEANPTMGIDAQGGLHFNLTEVRSTVMLGEVELSVAVENQETIIKNATL